MEYRTLGSSGLRVSLVGLGCNNFGRRIDYAASQPVVHNALDLGVTLFDTADVYRSAIGGSEEFLKQLEEFYGLLPLGGKQPIYFGQQIIESLIRHAKDERVVPLRRRATREALRRERRLRRGRS